MVRSKSMDTTKFTSAKIEIPEPKEIDYQAMAERDSARHLDTMKEIDMAAEEQMALFMDRYFYQKMKQQKKIFRFERVYDYDRQFSGADVVLTTERGCRIIIDEKAQLHYINHTRDTFSFEISFLRPDKAVGQIPTTGWLCNNQLKTDEYVLIWPLSAEESSQVLRWTDLQAVECMIINKKKLLRNLEMNGFSTEKMMQDAKNIRARCHPCTERMSISTDKGLHYVISGQLREVPINLILPKAYLTKLASGHYLVTPERITRFND